MYFYGVFELGKSFLLIDDCMWFYFYVEMNDFEKVGDVDVCVVIEFD